MKYKFFFAISLLLVLILGSCGYKTPVPRSSKDLLELDPSTAWIRGRGLSDEDVLYLSRIKGAKSIDLCGGSGWPLKMTDVGFENLKNVSSKLENLETLSICYADHITDKAIMQVAEMSYLKNICIERCSGLTDDALKYLSSSKSIESIVVNSCSGITNKGFEYLSENSLIIGVHIENFSLEQIDNRCLISLQEMPNLRAVSLLGTPFLDTNSMSMLAEFRNLRDLAISAEGCSQFTDDSLKALSQSRTIEELDLYTNDNLTFTGIRHLTNLKTLRTLYIGHIKKKPSRKELKSFHHALPSCTVEITNEAGVYIYDYMPH